MSTDRTTEILNYLSAISREVGAFRTETKEHFDRVDKRLDSIEGRLDSVEGRLERIEREQRLQGRRLDRIEGLLLTTSADVGELQDRVSVLEGKQK